MTLMSIIDAASDPHLTLRIRAAAVQEGIPAAASWAATHMDRIVSITVDAKTVAGAYASAREYLTAYVAQKQAELNTAGSPPVTVSLNVEVGAYLAAVSDDLITSAVKAVKAELATKADASTQTG